MRPLIPVLSLIALLAAAPALAQAPAGRIAEASGAVSLRPIGGTWAAAPRGAALLEGQTLRTGPRAQAELDLGANRLGLDPDTILRIDSAHPGMPAFTLEQGRAMFLLRSLQPGQVARINLPRGSVTLAEPGLYVVSAPEAGRPASVGVSRGLAQVYGPGVSLAVPAGQTGLFGGAEPATVRAGVADGFLADDPTPPPPQVFRPTPGAPPPPATPIAPPPDLAGVPGADPLRQQGSWDDLPDYGAVWYPPVAPSWNPYADPWQAERWGYAPWTSGAWIMIGPRWAWMPPRRITPPAWRYAYPPPGLGQPQRPPVMPPFAAPPLSAPNPFPAAPHVVAPRPMPPAAVLPPSGFAPGASFTPPPGMPRPPLAAPMAPPPVAAPPIAAAPVIATPRPSLPAALPPAASAPAAPSVFTPRPAPPPAALPPPMAAPRMPAPPMAAPPMAAPPRPAAPPPSRTCPPGRTIC